MSILLFEVFFLNIEVVFRFNNIISKRVISVNMSEIDKIKTIKFEQLV